MDKHFRLFARSVSDVEKNIYSIDTSIYSLFVFKLDHNRAMETNVHVFQTVQLNKKHWVNWRKKVL